MNSKISSVYLPKNYTYELEGLSLKISLKSNPFGLEPETLFALALRKNNRRRFLFVSKVLGKHTPVEPFLPLLAGAALAVQCYNKLLGVEHAHTQTIIQALKTKQSMPRVYELVVQKPLLALPEKTLFIGFAETATALGQAVFSLFDYAYYLHTTREQIPLLHSELDFREEHSHAVNHRCYPLKEDSLKTFEKIVLIDDELTTGNTVLNIIRAIHHQYPKKDYVVLSLLDWRSTEHRSKFRRFESELGIKIHEISLLEGDIDFVNPSGEQLDQTITTWEPRSYLKCPTQEGFPECKNKIILEFKTLDLPDVISVSSQDSIGHQNTTPYLKLTGRFGMSTSLNQKSIPLAQKIGRELGSDRQGTTTLCLGTGEFMHFPMLVSAFMGEGVVYHSTTRSPIYTIPKADYAIQNGCSYASPEDPGIINYIYNLPQNYYDEVYFFLEREVSRERLNPLVQLFQDRGIPRLVFVICVAPIPAPLPMGSYSPNDCIFLLKNLNGLIQETDLEIRERIIQSGGHYSEMLPVEYQPSQEYLNLFDQTLHENAFKVAEAVGIVSELILRRNGPKTVLVSLARAGTPIGVLIKRYLLVTKGLDLPHYSISIIRGRGMDENAILYILQQHPECKLQFIDGWTGKGAITKTLSEACLEFEAKYGYRLDHDLAVLTDPGHCVQTFGTREDFLIPSACLNSTVSGLVSRTVLREDLIGKRDFHGARYYQELEDVEVSNFFVDTVSAEFKLLQIDRLLNKRSKSSEVTWKGLKDLEQIQMIYGIRDINLIKPGLGETTRVLLRRLPERILVDDPDNPNLKHILLLAKDREVPVEVYPELTYASCGIIKQLP